MPAPDAYTQDQLAKLLGTPRAPVILDVRDAGDAGADLRCLPGAVMLGDAPAPAWAKAGPVAVVCQQGRKRAQGVAALLRAEGVAAQYLDGGFEGWRAAGLPLISPAALPPRDAEGRTRWVTRNRPKIDRIACPWLIRRFLDPRAVFLFVAAPEVEAVAALTGAAPFDIEGARFSHRGELCSFDALLDAFGLALPALDTLATVVRGADTARPDLAPEAAGLLAVSLGLSRMFQDDLAQLDAGLLVYDALYRWARDARGENHDWTGKA
ncbi:chromate resistance protein ChrB domain-containing protein [Pararhodobacter aggregans]|uniref:chromate resistance protein ChrB domain-containing protein n=1 Tax=Pararhodobacter aggregans TaxID=404875 RepID=UPI003A8F1517